MPKLETLIRYAEQNWHMLGAIKRRRLLRDIVKAAGDFTQEQWLQLCADRNYVCAECGQQFELTELTRDHIVPIWKGGKHTLSNIQPMCRSCNSRKQAKL
jgi:5-methylcytosine-specific restriction endonuclease McrA